MKGCRGLVREAMQREPYREPKLSGEVHLLGSINTLGVKDYKKELFD